MFTITKIDLLHEGGTKEYHILGVMREGAMTAVAVQRWSMVGRFGQFKTQRGSNSQVMRTCTDKFHEKSRRGYKLVKSDTFLVRDEESFKKALDELYHNRDFKENLRFLLEGVVWGNAASVPDDRLPDDLLNDIGEEEEEVEEETASASKENPNWGMF